MAAAHGTQDFGLRMPAPDCAFVPGEGAARLPVVATRIQIGRPSIPRKFLGFPTWSRKCDEWQSIDAIGTIANNNNNINNNNNVNNNLQKKKRAARKNANKNTEHQSNNNNNNNKLDRRQQTIRYRRRRRFQRSLGPNGGVWICGKNASNCS